MAEAVRLHSCNGCICPTIARAAAYFGIPEEELKKYVFFSGIKKNNRGNYDIKDLRYAYSQKFWMGQVRV